MKRNLFVLGDSISIYYGPYLKKMIKNKFSYDRKRGLKDALIDLDRPIGANGGDSRMVLDFINSQYESGRHFDVLLINCGLHDIRVDRNTGHIAVKLDEYALNLIDIIEKSKSISDIVVWAGITPVDDDIHNKRKEGYLRFNKDAEAYDKCAKNIMKRHNVPFIDLYSFTKSLGPGSELYRDHVHFNDNIARLQAAFIAGFLNAL